jgi:hypothetical protein
MKARLLFLPIVNRYITASIGIILLSCYIITPDMIYAQSDQHLKLESTILYSAFDTSNMKPEYSPLGEPEPVLVDINLRQHNESFKTEIIETTLSPRQQIEYMATMDAGEVLLYSWETNGKTYFDFHAHQENVDPDVWIRYADGGKIKAHGSIVAPYTGEHGWYFVNLDTKPVTLKLTISGYYKNMIWIDL